MSLNTAARRAAAVGIAALLLAAPTAAHAAAPPAPANSVGVLSLLDAGGAVLGAGSVTAQPGFSGALAPAPCPAGFADAARLGAIRGDGSTVVISATTLLADAAQPARVLAAPVLADYALGDGATVTLECLSLMGGIPVPAATVFSTGLDISGGAFTVFPAPAVPTSPPTVAPPTTTPATPVPTTAPSTVPSNAPTHGVAEGQGNNGLASTGAAALPLLAGAGLLLAGGTGLLLWRRRQAGKRG
ncbi:LPXTG cell wall anchor domain-containing protein [Arthrobacter sp. AQ5-05]|uniref:LPXTG cell wall anchor domain-containing protein n=1 Tax=Arthrobacter sp. AQ5-05 TaxID=2184581 RepID=UPI0012B5E98B|nr:LPXTG cell wall anchor domain-containing protein [Arthrobacter sp. AQ5-05]